MLGGLDPWEDWRNRCSTDYRWLLDKRHRQVSLLNSSTSSRTLSCPRQRVWNFGDQDWDCIAAQVSQAGCSRGSHAQSRWTDLSTAETPMLGWRPDAGVLHQSDNLTRSYSSKCCRDHRRVLMTSMSCARQNFDLNNGPNCLQILMQQSKRWKRKDANHLMMK